MWLLHELLSAASQKGRAAQHKVNAHVRKQSMQLNRRPVHVEMR